MKPTQRVTKKLRGLFSLQVLKEMVGIINLKRIRFSNRIIRIKYKEQIKSFKDDVMIINVFKNFKIKL